MTEAEWLACTDPRPMLAFLRGKASDRKLRLFACACCRHIWYYLDDLKYYGECQGVLIAEPFADGLVGKSALRAAHLNAKGSASKLVTARRLPVEAIVQSTTIHYGRHPGEQGDWKSSILRDIFHNPFRPISPDSTWLAWNDGIVVKLAQAAYEQRSLPDGKLDLGQLAILADALEDAGCTNADILVHCRELAEHVRGCWVLDLLLDKS